MHKLAAVIQPMKSSFIVAHLRPREFVVEMQVGHHVTHVAEALCSGFSLRVDIVCVSQYAARCCVTFTQRRTI